MVVESLYNIERELREKSNKYDYLRSELKRITEVYIHCDDSGPALFAKIAYTV